MSWLPCSRAASAITGTNCGTFTPILRLHQYDIGAGGASPRRGRVGRAVVNDDQLEAAVVAQVPERSLDVANGCRDAVLLEVGGNNQREAYVSRRRRSIAR